MSSRQLRKLQKQRELEKAQGHAEEDLDEVYEDDQPGMAAPKPRVSLFAALGGDTAEDADQDEDEDEADEHSPQAISEESPVQPMPASKKSRKKKKKKKAKAADPRDEGEKEADAEEDEIDKAMKALNIPKQQVKGSSGTVLDPGSGRRINELLSINPYNLKVANEMRQLFGRDVMESAEAEEELEHNRRRRGPAQRQVDLETFLRGPPGAKRLPEVTLRRNVFILGRDHWPRQTAGGLTMKTIGRAADGAGTEYAYVHDKNYDAVQIFFFSCVGIGDPMRLVYLLQQVPYHVSTLLQVSSVAKQDQNMALSAELYERALFTFGRVATSAFRQDLEHGRARLDFRRPENRQLWLAGYHYLKSLLRKGTYRTALEWAKLLYSLDLDDPYAMRHFLHFLGIRAYQAQWLVDFVEEMDKTSAHADTVYLRQSLVLAKLQMGDKEGARNELQAGMQRIPWLFCALFQELGLDAPPSIWGIGIDTNARSFWVKLYIYQMKDLWNNAEATGLLQEVAKAIGRVDTASLPGDDARVDRGATRLAYLEGQTSLLAVAPRELLESQPNYEFDPLPPPEGDNIFTGEGTRLPWREGRQRHGQGQGPGQPGELEARMRELLARQAAAGVAGVAGVAGGAGPDGEDDDGHEAELIAADDEELRRDLEAHAARGGGGGGGLFGRLMQLMGAARPGHEAGDDSGGEGYDDGAEMEVEAASDETEEGERQREGLPGSWPEEEGDDDEHGRR